MVQGAVVSSVAEVFLVPFCVFHFWLLVNNMTTIEYCEKRLRRTSLYDQGVFANIRSVMGPRAIEWLLPFSGPTGDGVFWTVNPAAQLEDGGDAGPRDNCLRDTDVPHGSGTKDDKNGLCCRDWVKMLLPRPFRGA